MDKLVSKCADLEKEYKKNKTGIKPEDVQKMSEWVSQQPHLPTVHELELIIFMNSCYYSTEVTKQCIDTYYTIRTHCPDFFANKVVDSDGVRAALDTTLLTPLPRTDIGYQPFYARLVDYDLSKFYWPNVFKAYTMAVDLMLLTEGTAEGHYVVIDMDGFTLSHLASLGILLVKKFIYYFQEGMPVRMKGLHFVNIVPFMDKVLALIKPFMKKSLIDMMELYKKPDEHLFKMVPKRCWPKEYGGEAGTMKELHDKMKKNLYENAAYFVEEEKYRIDESKRPGKAKNAGDIFGVEGSFKKLDID